MYKYDGVCYFLKGKRNTSLKVKNQVAVDNPVKASKSGSGSAENSHDKTQESGVLLFFVDNLFSLPILFSYC